MLIVWGFPQTDRVFFFGWGGVGGNAFLCSRLWLQLCTLVLPSRESVRGGGGSSVCGTAPGPSVWVSCEDTAAAQAEEKGTVCTREGSGEQGPRKVPTTPQRHPEIPPPCKVPRRRDRVFTATGRLLARHTTTKETHSHTPTDCFVVSFFHFLFDVERRTQ